MKLNEMGVSNREYLTNLGYSLPNYPREKIIKKKK